MGEPRVWKLSELSAFVAAGDPADWTLEYRPVADRSAFEIKRATSLLPTTKPLDLEKTGAELSWKRARHDDTTVYCFTDRHRV